MAAGMIQPDDDWEDTSDAWVDDTPELVSNPESKEEPSMLSKAWGVLNKPLVNLKGVASKAANWADTPELDDSYLTSLGKGFVAGATQGVGDVVSDLTSPMNLATAALSGGSSLAAKRGLSTLAKSLTLGEAGISALQGVHGANEIRRGNYGQGGMELLGAGIGGLDTTRRLKNGFDMPVPKIAGETPVVKTVGPTVIPEKPVVEEPPIGTTKTNITPDDALDWVDTEIDKGLTAPREPIVQPKVEIAPAPKPKIKVKLNPETNSLEPDLSDELTAKVMNSAKTGEPIPDGQRLNPDDEIDLEDLTQGSMFDLESDYKPQSKFSTEGVDKAEGMRLEDARQGEMKEARVNDTMPETNGQRPNPLTAKKMAGAKQAELPGKIREAAPDKFVPGGRPMKPREVTKTQEWLGLPRALQSAFDLSFPLRQGLGLIHTKGWWKAWPDMIKSFGSDEVYKGVMDSIANRPNFRGREVTLRNGKKVVEQSLAQKAGLAITDLVNNREEELGSKIAGQIPLLGKGVKASNRAYNAFANKLRADAFDVLVAQNPQAKTDLVLAKQLAEFVNNASGRGKLPGEWEGAAVALNNMLFSPRLMASRLQMLNPKNYIFTKPQVRMEYLKSTLATAGTWITLAGLAKAGGAEVSMDPESSDFGKIKIGNTRMDPAGGFQQYLVLATRLAKGGLDKARETSDRRYSGKAFAPTPEGDILNFIKNKMAPDARLAAGPWLANKNQPFELGDQAMRTFTPIMLQDLSEIMQENPDLAWTLLPGLAGVGVNTYKPGKQSPTLLPKSIWNRKKDITFR